MTRAIVVSGTLGAGKTRTAEYVHDLLVRRGDRSAVIDLDWLCQLDPAPAGDRFNDQLGFANLAAIWPNYQAALPGCVGQIARTDELAATLKANNLDDLVVTNERPSEAVAVEILAGLVW